MALLKDTIITGSLRVTDTTYTTDLILSGSKTARYALIAPTSDGAPTFRALTNADVGLGNVENTKLSTWAGTNKITTLGTITTGTWSATTIAANKGGTGQTAYTIGDILYCGTANTLSKLGGNTTTTRKFLRSVATTSGTAVAPAWDTVTKTDVGLSNVENTKLSTWAGTNKITTVGTIGTGTWQGTAVGTAYGGTGNTSFTQWGVIYANPATKLVSTAAGTSGYLLQGNGSAAPSWIQATNANTGSTIVKRDASGNFSAGTITAALSGNAATATALSNIVSNQTASNVQGALQAFWNAQKSTMPRDKIISFTSDHSGRAMHVGYFINGYDSNPYGGFFTAFYNTPYYSCSANGTFSCYELVRNDSRTYSINVSGSSGSCTGNAATATTARSVSTLGGDVILGTSGSASNDSGDIVWTYGNGQEKMRIWTDNAYTAMTAPNFREYKSDGTSLYSGYLVLGNGTGASGTWGINVTGSSGSCTGNAATATNADQLDGYHASSLWRSDGGTWNNGANISCTGGGEWSFDLNGDGYLHVWSSQNGKSILKCDNYSCNVTIPSGGIICNHGVNFMVGGNEFNFIPDSYNSTVWFNYTSYNRNNTSIISYYIFGNGRTGAMAYIGPNYFQAANGDLLLYASNQNRVSMQTDRNLVIYDASGSSVWQSNTSTSTYRVKESITPIDKNEINNLFKLNVIRFNYKKEMNYYDTSRRYGMIAEEVLPLFPDIVDIPENYDPTKFDLSKGIHQPLPGIRYERFIPLLIRCVQLQQERIDQLEKLVKERKNL